MVINTKSHCGMCRENKDSADFLSKDGKPTTICAMCQKLMEAFNSGRGTDEITGTAKEILTSSGLSVEQIKDLVSPTAAADNVVMTAIGMDVFNNRIKPANKTPDSVLAQELITANFTGMIGFDNLEQPAQQPVMVRKEQAEQAKRQEKQIIEYAQLEQLYRDAVRGPAPPIFRPVTDEELPWNKFTEAPSKPAEPPPEIGRVARAIAGEDEE